MRIACFANNWLGWKVVEWLTRGETVTALVLHPRERRRFGAEILGAARKSESDALDGSRLGEKGIRSTLAGSGSEIAISANFGYRLDESVRSLFPRGCLNIHTALLPYNRGANPNVWSIVEGTPSGVTIHHMDDGWDTGDIVSQRAVPVEPTDTGESLYLKLQSAAVELLAETWPAIREGRAPRTPQDPGKGCFHRTSDLESLDRIDPERSLTAEELINILRARTFPPYPSAYFLQDGRRVYVEVRLTKESEPEHDGIPSSS